MSKLYKTLTDIKAVDMGKDSSLPLLFTVNTEDSFTRSDLPEGDGLFLHYEFLKSGFPYTFQDGYSRDFNGKTLEAVVLENDYLKATFTPSLGGKLWSLFDKAKGKELLFANPVMRPAYLATRNAWCSGGIEWNCGIFGHSPLTCSPLFAATLKMKDGTPVLRLYEYERVRGVVYQMDFFLPDDSKALYARMRVVNPSFRTTAMYWWSNIAVPQSDDMRVVVPAEGAYTPVNGKMSVVNIPLRDGVDVTYPNNNPIAIDYFFRTDKTRRMYHSQLSKDGYGLFETSTSRLQGRKLFVWGQGPGGRKWQEYLSGDGCLGRYNEIQCGLAHTQSEHLPMPPRTAWEWMEVFGPMQADPAIIHGDDWDAARAEVEAHLNEIITAEDLEKMLQDTHEMALTPADEMLNFGSGWGALENMRRAKDGFDPMCAHLDFGTISEAQQPWADLLEDGSLGEKDPKDIPASWMRQLEWTRKMEKAIGKDGKDQNNWYTYLQLGCTYLAQPDLLRARLYIEKSLALKENAWALYALAEILRLEGDEEAASRTMIKAADLLPEDESLAKMTARTLNKLKNYEALEAFTGSRSETIQKLPRLRLYRAFALMNLGRTEEAEALLYQDGKWLEVPDIQEGEISLSDLWYGIEEAKAGHPIDRQKVAPPYELDFRMFAK